MYTLLMEHSAIRRIRTWASSSWNIQLTFDWVSIEPYGAYPCNPALTAVERVQEFLRHLTFFVEIIILEMTRSIRMVNSNNGNGGNMYVFIIQLRLG